MIEVGIQAHVEVDAQAGRMATHAVVRSQPLNPFVCTTCIPFIPKAHAASEANSFSLALHEEPKSVKQEDGFFSL